MTQLPLRALLSFISIIALTVIITACSSGSAGTDPGTNQTGTSSTLLLDAQPGPIKIVGVGETATLDGTFSSASTNDTLSYAWSFTSVPDGSNVQLQNATSANPSFIADVQGTYRVQLTVSAGGVTSQRTVAVVQAGQPTGPVQHQNFSSDCKNCHSGENIVVGAKIADHLATSNLCQACHSTFDFATVASVDHAEVFGNCSECHDGVKVIGKSLFHEPTDGECDDCHNTTSFLNLLPDGSYDHTNLSKLCSACHNGAIATGMTTTVSNGGMHPDTSSECGYCHTTTTFLDAYPDHTGPSVIGHRCDSCHGVAANDAPSDPPVGHPDTFATGVDCNVCHSIVTFKMSGGIFNHRVVDPTVQPCESCHNASNSINAKSTADAVNHPSTTSDCGACHNTEAFKPAFGFDHTGVVNNCQTCHGNNSPVPPQVTATGKPLATPFYAHMPTNPDNPGTASDQDCGDCHTAGTFTTGTYDHFGVTNNCNSCHNNVIGVGKLPNHIPTTPDNQDCADCHNTTTFIGATFNHAGIVDNCASCHDGVISTGKSINHVQTSQDCASCHNGVTSNFATFAGTFFHDFGLVGNDCASCHNTGIAKPKKLNHIPAQAECSQCHNDTSTGGFLSSTFMGAVHPGIISGCEGCHNGTFSTNSGKLNGKPGTHIPTAQDCDVCHTNASFMAPTNFSHAGITGNCESCHDGNYVVAGALGKADDPTPPHPVTTADCGACHAIGNLFKDGIFDHTGIVNNCASCHGDNPTATPTGRKKNPLHVPTTQDCSVCHVTGTFKPSVFNHTGIVDNCASCHGDNATTAVTKKSPGHVATTQDCSVCHNTTIFAGARFDHSGIVDNCASCHDGATARGKTPPPNHVPTNQDCSVCHQTTGFKPATFDHTGIVNNCRSCHDGKYAKGKSIGHVATNQDCSICHNTSLPLSFLGAVFDHTGIVDNCESCHDGVTAKGKAAKTNPPHLATALDCHLCHTTATFVGGTWVHDASTTNNCDQCHIQGGAAKRYKLPTHLNTTEQCDVCHTTNAWAPSIFKHSAQGNYPGDHRRDPGCKGCHKGSISGGINIDNYPTQLRYAPFCAGCHAKNFKSDGSHNGGKNGTIEQNKNCAGSGCHKVRDSNF